jgi:hypothetical protein
MNPSNYIKEEQEKLNQAYQDFLEVCHRVSGDTSKTGTEIEIAFQRVKTRHDLALSGLIQLIREWAEKREYSEMELEMSVDFAGRKGYNEAFSDLLSFLEETPPQELSKAGGEVINATPLPHEPSMTWPQGEEPKT